MKKLISNILVMAFIGTLASCTKKNSETANQPQKPVQEESALWVVGEGQLNGNLDFGTFSLNQSKILTVLIKNLGESSVSANPQVEAPFEIVYQSGCNPLPSNKSCTVKLLFSSQGKVGGNYSGEITLGSYVGLLSAVVDAPEITQNLSIKVNSIDLTDSIDFGALNYRQSTVKTISVKNNGPVSTDVPVSLDTTDYSIVYNNCSMSPLKSNKSCNIKLFLSGQGKSGAVEGSISIGERLLSISSQITGRSESVEVNSNLVSILDNQNLESSAALDLGTLNTNAQVLKNLFLKNTGSDSSPALSVSLSTGDLLYNQCQNQQLKPNQSCRMQFYVPTVVKGSNQVSVAVQGYEAEKEFSLEYLVRTPGDKIDCTNNMTGVDLAEITWNGSSYSACEIVSCESEFHLGSNSCISNQESCDITNGVGLSFWNGSSFGDCEIQSCNTNYHIVGNACAADVVNCVADNAAVATQTWNGSSFDTCTISSCVANYHLTNNQCDLDVISCSKPNATVATQTWNASTLSYDACSISTCESTHHLTNNNCDANVISCSAQNATAATQTWVPATSSYGICTISNCAANHHLTNNQCIIDTVNVAVTQPSKGTLSGPSSVNYGSSATISYTPVSGYKILAWGGDCAGTDPNSSCVINNVTSPKNVSVTIDTLPMTIVSSYAPYLTTAIQVNQCSIIGLTLKDVQGANLNRPAASVVNFTPTADMQYYSDSNCSTAISSTTFASGTATKTVYLKNKASFATGSKSLVYSAQGTSTTLSDTRNLVRPISCLDAKNKGFYNNAGQYVQSGYHTIEPTGLSPMTVHCDQSTNGGGWTLVAFNNGNSGLANMPGDFFARSVNPANMANISASPSSSSLNTEVMSAQMGTTDVMFVSPAYYSGAPLIENGIGQWNYNSTKCSGTFRHTSRVAGCPGQAANDNYDSADRFNVAFESATWAIVPMYVNSGQELCYSGRTWCSFQFYLR